VIVAVFGTTISPYMFFWQSSQEVEEIDKEPSAKPLAQAPRQAKRQLARIWLDTVLGMALSNIVAMAIMISTAATLHLHGKTNITTAADAAEALRPVAGNFAFALFCLGIIGTGLLAVPVLAGSAAYAFGESQGWKCGLEYKPWEAIGFYSVISVATLLGIGIDLSPLDPMRALFWSAVINGFVAVPIMAAMMFLATRRDQMGRFVVTDGTRALGWSATLVMAIAAFSMLIF
jgi:Mn2+/Fe2+ NRAMP family transporter